MRQVLRRWHYRRAEDFDGYERLLDVAKGFGPTAHLVVLLGGEAGLRCGEMIGLEWGDVDLVKRLMCIQGSEWRGHVTVPKGGRLFVPMTARIAAALQGHRHLKSKRVLCLETMACRSCRSSWASALGRLGGTAVRYMHLSSSAVENAIRLVVGAIGSA